MLDGKYSEVLTGSFALELLAPDPDTHTLPDCTTTITRLLTDASDEVGVQIEGAINSKQVAEHEIQLRVCCVGIASMLLFNPATSWLVRETSERRTSRPA